MCKKQSKFDPEEVAHTIRAGFVILLLAGMNVFCGSGKEISVSADFFDLTKPGIVVGDKEINPTSKEYRIILNYHVDNNGNIYVSDVIDLCIDKYDPQGRYIGSYGRKGQGPGEFTTPPENFSVDSKGNLFAMSWPKNTMIVFSDNYQLVKEVKLSEEFRERFIRALKFNTEDELIILTWSEKTGYCLGKYNLENAKYTVFHSDNKRMRPHFGDILPDYSFDNAGNIYVTDTIEYKVHIYSKQGTFLDSIDKEMGKNQILEDDFNLFFNNSVGKLPTYEQYWNRLTGESRYFPDIIGINIDGNRIYIWTSNQDIQKKYWVDVYNSDRKNLGKFSMYNFLPKNLVVIKNGKIYTPNIGSEDVNLKKQIGRFGMINTPDKIEVYSGNSNLPGAH